ncbi:hypothetical protein TRFO_28052 [Tritrichomonas foetus]|uniref:Peptidase M28 domain-containing protein n=1 Tax=Tritrichomonas foetus TaxID=1144522 RepID=A0A1J4K466_9EUKA|nr:hypothetical protein TRFO_28052 [Tritrichomonas foetus]|eukprot:OHT04486.1 hypothetical protein TRFO_28052 [Tritrichomonas foetus]
MKHLFHLSFLLVIIYYIILEGILRGSIFPNIFNKKFPNIQEDPHLYQYFSLYPRTPGSKSMNITAHLLYEVVEQIFNNKSDNKFKLYFNIASSNLQSRNKAGMTHIQTSLNSSVLYFKRRGKKSESNPIIITCRFDTSPLSISSFDSTLHIIAIIKAVQVFLDDPHFNISNDFAFVLNGCEEYGQLGAKYLMTELYPEAYYLSLSGFGVGRPFILFTQSNLSSSVMKSLSHVRGLPMISGISEIPMFRYLNDANRFMKSTQYYGAEVSFIGNPSYHGTNLDVDKDQTDESNVKLILSCIMTFLNNFKMDENETRLVSFGVAPFVLLVQQTTLEKVSNVIPIILCLYIPLFVNLKSLFFLFKFISALSLTFALSWLYTLVLSVVNSSSLTSMPFLTTFFMLIIMINVLILILSYFRVKTGENWHLLQVFYLTMLTLLFRKSEFNLPILLTIAFYFIQQFASRLRYHLPLLMMTLSPSILIYSTLYRSCSYASADYPIFLADLIPFYLLYFFFIHLSIFLLPFFFDNAPISTYSLLIAKLLQKIHQKNETPNETKSENTGKVENKSVSRFKTPIKNNINLKKKSQSEKVGNKQTIDLKKQNKTNKFSTPKKQSIPSSPKRSNHKKSYPKPLKSSNKNESNSEQDSKKIDFLEFIHNPHKMLFISLSLLFIFLVKPNPFSKSYIIRGTFSQYIRDKAEESELSFVPYSGRKISHYLYREISKHQNNISYEPEFCGRIASECGPAIVQRLKKSRLPSFFDHWPRVFTSSIDLLTDPPYRQVNLNIENMSTEIDFIIISFQCTENKTCVSKPPNKFFKPMVSSKNSETVFRVGGMSRKFFFEINITQFAPVAVTIAYQSFRSTIEKQAFENAFGSFVKGTVDEYQIAHTVFVQTTYV